MEERMRWVASCRRATTEALKKIQIITPEDRYDLEYSSASELAKLTQGGEVASFVGTHYWFWSPVIMTRFLESIMSLTHDVLDVGAGNGTLICKLIALGWCPKRLTGVDISRKACQRIQELGARAFKGTIVALADTTKYDRIFLSYFVDRDADQRATFTKAVRLLQPGGAIVLEGLFPCEFVDSCGISHGNPNVTKGKNAEEDVQLVITEFAQLGLELEQRSDGVRFVYSMDGPETLPSTILVFKKGD